MTPREKAKEIISKLNNIPSEEPCFIMSVSQRKKSALVLIDEFVNILAIDPPRPSNVYQTHKYWLSVKEEIISLADA